MGASELGYEYKLARAKLKREAPPYCGYCGEWIDREIPWPDPMCWTCDHIIPLDKGGDPGSPDDLSNLQPMHNKHNVKKSNKTSHDKNFKQTRVW